MADLFTKVRGFIGSIFRFGTGGPQLRVNSDAEIEARNSDNTQPAIIRGRASTLVAVRNETGSLIPAGTLVSPVGQASPGVALVDIADKRIPAVRPAIGVLEQDLPDATTGTALTTGYLTGVVDTSAWAVNDQLALGDAGAFTPPPPDTDPFEGEIQLLAVVTKVGVADGELWIGINPSLEALTGAHAFFLREVSATGHISGGAVTRAGGLDLDVAPGIGFVNQGFDLTRVVWNADTVTVPPDTLFTVVVDVAGVVQVVLVEDPKTHIILARGYSDSTDVILLSDHEINLNQAAAQAHDYLRDVIGPVLAGGLAVSVHSPPSLQVAVDAGEFYVDNHRLMATANAPAIFRYWYMDGLGGWITVAAQTDFDPDQYDDGSGVLAALTPGQFKRDLLFVSVNDDGTEYHVVYGQQTFASQAEAEAGNDPIPPPQLLTSTLRVAGIVLAQGAIDITSVIDRRPFLGQLATGSSVANDHGLLTGLGDDDHPQYVHTGVARSISAQHSFAPAAPAAPFTLGANAQGQLVTGLNADQLDGFHATDFVMGTHAATHEDGGADEIDVTGLSGLLADAQTPLAHAASHQHGGSDEVATATPAANAIPKAGPAGTLATGWIPAHASSHQHGGGDEVATATPAANAIPKAGGGATLAEGWMAQATESVRGSAELATQAETDTGTDDLRIVTPLKLRTTPLAGRDTTAFHSNVAGEIAALTLKAAPVVADHVVIEDSAAANAKRRVTVGGLRGTRERFFGAETRSGSGNFRTRSVGGAGNFNFNFVVPNDYTTLVSLELIGFATSAGAVGAGKDIDLSSSYGAVGELNTTHTGSDTTSTYTIPAQNTFFAINLAPVFASLAAGDFAGVNVNHIGIGGSVDYLGIRLRYT